MQFRKLFSLLIALLILLISDPILAKETNQKKSFSFEKDGTEWVSPKGIGLQREYSTAKTQQLQDLPATYDLRNLNGRSYISPVSDQGGFGTCWAFSALNSAQSNLMLKGVTDNIDFSTKALAWFAYQYQGLEGTPDDEFEGMFSLNSTFSQLESPTFDELTSIYFNGGAADTAYTQMSSWLGASTEKEIPYTNDKGTYIVDLFGSFMPDPNGDWALDYDAIYNDAYHLQNAQWIPGMRETNNVNAYVPLAKEQILENGAIALFYGSINETSPYFDDLHGSQYIPPTETNIRPNHAVTVIGWDDNYSKDAFSTPAPGNGAWIIQNSWGKTFANQGYFYLSYYD